MVDSIQKNKVISIHYTLRGEDKVVLDSSTGGDPLAYLHGHGQIIPGLERSLEGKVVGDKLSVVVEPKDGYGDYDSNMIASVQKKDFPPGSKIAVGEMFEVADSKGTPLVVRIIEVKDEKITVDGNHPLSGKKLFFEVEVVKVREATAQEIEHGHAHDGMHSH